MNVVIVEIHGKHIIGVLEQLDAEPSIVLHNAYEIITNIYEDIEFNSYPPYASENVVVFNSIHVTTIYPPGVDIMERYNNIANSNSQLLLS